MKTTKALLLGILGIGLAIAGQVQAQTVTKFAGGGYHSLFIKSDGSLWATGRDDNGQLGDGILHLEADQPEQIVASNVTAVAAGDCHSLFIKSDGSLWGMGNDGSGELGDGTYGGIDGYTNQPEQIVASNVTAVAAGYVHSLFIKSDGSLWAMGFNYDGELGDGNNGSAPNYAANLPQMIVASNVTAIAGGYQHSLFLKSNGSVWGMGDNYFGELGDGIRSTNAPYGFNVPVQSVVSNVTAIAAGEYFSLFLKSDGSLWAVGNNSYGQLGDGTYNNTNLPEQIVASGVTAIAAGEMHSLFLKSDGSLWATGRNTEGQLGDGSFNNTNQPEEIVGSNVTAIAAGEYHSLFLKSDGGLWAMGFNEYGGLGDGTDNPFVNQPEQIVAGSPPVLVITTVSNMPLLVWSGLAATHVLQMTTNLASGNWVTVTNGIPFSGLQITNAPGTAFFRLN
jgi:alpha-tubulin suppressor-like RCC1 family protein